MSYPFSSLNFTRKGDPVPLTGFGQDNQDDPSPLIPNDDTALDDAVPIIPSPGYSVDQHPNPNQRTFGIPLNNSSVRDAESSKTSIAVLAQSSAGSIMIEDRAQSGNGIHFLLQ